MERERERERERLREVFLWTQMIRLEFSHYDYSGKGTISVKDFGLSMVASADLSQLNHYLDRVEALGNDVAFKDCRVTFEVSTSKIPCFKFRFGQNLIDNQKLIQRCRQISHMS